MVRVHTNLTVADNSGAKRLFCSRVLGGTRRRYARVGDIIVVAVKEAIPHIPADTIRRAAEMYARGPNTSTLWAMGLTQHSTGTDIVASLRNLMLVCGMIGRWGAAMIPIRGQNNVQGSRDMGAIPFAYTDYRSVTDPEVRAEYASAWGVPEESLSLEKGMMVTEMVDDASPIRGMYIMGENPVISDPNIAHAEHWVRSLEFLAVQDLFLTETARWADVVLPGSSFAEKQGTFANTDRHIQLSDPAVPPLGQARRDLDILVDLSLHMEHNRLLTFARKPAPVQVTYLGYPGTTGLGAIDYKISDPVLDPVERAQRWETERIVRIAAEAGT